MAYQNPNQGQQSSYGQPQYAQPQYGQMPYGQPQYAQPQFGQPAFGQPMYGQVQMQYAGVGPRFVASLIDALVFIVVAIPFILLYVNSQSSSVLIAMDLLLGILAFAYYIVMEAIWGATLGKMALGLRVVKMDGSPIGWKESVIRNLLRIVDGLFDYLVAAILIWSSPLRQRLGDRAAGTVVVRRRS